VPADDSELQAALSAMRARIHLASKVIATKGGLVIQQVGMKHTKVVSGTLRRSWRTEPLDSGGVYGARVGPTTVYARRQELGFLPPLKDSLGRSFPTAYGWPYVKPSLDEARPMVGTLARNTYAAAMRV